MLLECVDTVMAAWSHQITFLFLFAGICGVFLLLLLIRRDEIRFVLYLPPSISFQPSWLWYISITCPISLRGSVGLCVLVFFSTELILPPFQNFTVVTFKNCKWLCNSHGPSHQCCCALSKHSQQALKQLRAKHSPVFCPLFLPVMKMQCLCIHGHCLRSSTVWFEG